MRHARIELKVDDGVVQLTGQLADFVVQPAITDLVELVDQLHRGAEVALFEAVDQIAGIIFQGRLEVTQRGVCLLYTSRCV